MLMFGVRRSVFGASAPTYRSAYCLAKRPGNAASSASSWEYFYLAGFFDWADDWVFKIGKTPERLLLYLILALR